MSGTSRDGIDLAYIETNGEKFGKVGPGKTYPYPAEFKKKLTHMVAIAPQELSLEKRDGPLSPILKEGGEELARLHHEAIKSFIKEFGLEGAVDFIGFHGHTLLHDPAHSYTFQLGDGALLYQLGGIPVIYNLRQADIEAGGQGAPLAPLYHQAKLRDLGITHPVAILNLGGVGNVTYLEGDKVIGFDTGPGGALIDDWMTLKTGHSMDLDGQAAAAGKVNASLLNEGLADPYFSQPLPKSLDRDHFNYMKDKVQSFSMRDGAATLTAFTAHSVGKSLNFFPHKPQAWYVTGGGRLNKTLLTMISQQVGAPVACVEELGWDGDSLEAELMGFLAARHYYQLPLSVKVS
jgi:anhydro-N-acetylmuramic acid kinase